MPVFPTNQPDATTVDSDPAIGLDGGTINDLAKELQVEINANKRDHPDTIEDFISALDSSLE